MNALRKIALQDNGFKSAVRGLLSGTMSGHLGPYMYTEDSNDQRWKQGHSSKNYYLGRDDEASFKLVLAGLNISVPSVLDLGPGGEESIMAKTLPLLNAVQAKRYYGVDLSPTLAEGSADITSNRLHIEAKPLVADFFETLPYQQPNTLVALMGGTLGNIETQSTLDAVKSRLKKIFDNYQRATAGNGHFLVSFDANNNGDEVKTCYQSEQFDFLIRSCIERAIDTSNFVYDVEWDETTKRLALGLRSTADQMIELDDEQYAVEAGQFLSVLNSYRYDVKMVTECAKAAGWDKIDIWSSSSRSHYILFKSA